MRTLLLLVLSLFTILAYGQTIQTSNITIENKYAALNDSLSQVIYKNMVVTHRNPAWLVNGREVGESGLKTLDPEQFASVNVSKKEETIDNITYDGSVSITMKKGYFVVPQHYFCQRDRGS